MVVFSAGNEKLCEKKQPGRDFVENARDRHNLDKLCERNTKSILRNVISKLGGHVACLLPLAQVYFLKKLTGTCVLDFC